MFWTIAIIAFAITAPISIRREIRKQRKQEALEEFARQRGYKF